MKFKQINVDEETHARIVSLCNKYSLKIVDFIRSITFILYYLDACGIDLSRLKISELTKIIERVIKNVNK